MWYIILMKDEKYYRVELHADGKKCTDGSRFSGFDSANAFFSTDAEVGSVEFNEAMDKAVFRTGGQEVAHGWKGWTVGALFMQDGAEPVSVMSPAWEYHKGSSFPTWKEVLPYNPY